MTANLIFDGDDTLWENNVLFERAIEDFIDHLAHPMLSREQVREHLDEIERVNCRRYGYGVDSFERSLVECLSKLRGNGPPTDADRAILRTACQPIRSNSIELLAGVRETLGVLSERNSLFLLTKGDPDEQVAKVAASGLAEMFLDVGIVREKEPATYAEFIEARSLRPEETWMIGNSPKSDIRPALEVGLGAVLVPHPMTWSLEVDELPYEHVRFDELSPFSALRDRF